MSGRPQFQPSIAVDQTTGTLVMSWFDTRNDASRARVATYVTYSIDGGNTFSPQVYANVPQTATDAITGDTVILGPVPDNESPGNPNTEGTFGFGDHQGLAVYGGHVYPAWASNQVPRWLISGGPDGKALLNIKVATVLIPAGPRIISSTEGPVGDPGDTVNNTRTSDGTPIVSAFDVTFDRPVDPATFTPNLVQVFFHDTTASNATGGLVPVTSVEPLNLGPLGATEFQVNFAPRSAVGTYSYAISPGSQRPDPHVDHLGRLRPARLCRRSTRPMARSRFSLSIPRRTTPGMIDSTIQINNASFVNQVVSSLTVTVNITSTNDTDLILTLISPDNTPIILFNGPQTAAGSVRSPRTSPTRPLTTRRSGRSAVRGSAPAAPFMPARSSPPSRCRCCRASRSTAPGLSRSRTRARGSTTTYDSWSLNITPGTVDDDVEHRQRDGPERQRGRRRDDPDSREPTTSTRSPRRQTVHRSWPPSTRPRSR